ncbi:hypothetical protein PAMP_002775 [Pampus punctatissimus]
MGPALGLDCLRSPPELLQKTQECAPPAQSDSVVGCYNNLKQLHQHAKNQTGFDCLSNETQESTTCKHSVLTRSDFDKLSPLQRQCSPVPGRTEGHIESPEPDSVDKSSELLQKTQECAPPAQSDSVVGCYNNLKQLHQDAKNQTGFDCLSNETQESTMCKHSVLTRSNFDKLSPLQRQCSPVPGRTEGHIESPEPDSADKSSTEVQPKPLPATAKSKNVTVYSIAKAAVPLIVRAAVLGFIVWPRECISPFFEPVRRRISAAFSRVRATIVFFYPMNTEGVVALLDLAYELPPEIGMFVALHCYIVTAVRVFFRKVARGFSRVRARIAFFFPMNTEGVVALLDLAYELPPEIGMFVALHCYIVTAIRVFFRKVARGFSRLRATISFFFL